LQTGVELAIIVVAFFSVIFLCASMSFGRGRASGETKITRPTERNPDGFGGAKALDYTHAPSFRGADKAGIPVSGRLEREKTDTHKMSKGDEEEHL
jgi:hypothetical protein